MLLTIHDANLRKVAFIDNDKQATLNYFNDTWTRYLETGSSTFDFTVFKKAIISDVGRKRAYNYLNEKAFVSFQYKGKTYLHTIRKIEENEKTIKCYGINLNLELINEYANPYKATKAMTFKEYCDAMDLLNFTFLKIGVNEVSTQKITAEWEGADTKLNRLLSLAKKFGAEIEFDTYLNADSSIKSFVINVYHENDDTHQGVGRISPTVLTYGKNLKTLTRTVDKTNIYNMVRPTGRTDNGDIVTISGLSAWSVNNAKGEREFYQAGEGLYAPLSMQMYPSAFTSKTTNDQWIRKDMQVESSNPDVIRSMAYRELKKNCYPAVTYEAEGFADLEIGDTVQVYDDGFSPVLLLEMRVSEQSISFTNPKNNKTTFSNAKALENRLSGGIQQRIDQMIEDAKPYTIKVATDNGVGFKNGQGQSVVTPTLMKGNKVINSGWRWVVDGIIKSTSPSYIVKATDINHTMVLTITAWVDNKEVASEQITFINTVDGTAGNGIASVDTYYLLTGMSSGVTRDIAGWTQTVKTPTSNQRFVWSYRVENYSDGTSSVGEPYILSIYGEKGDPGKDGQNGQIPHIAYADITEIVKQSDPEFKIGANTLTAYNNLANGNVVMERITAESDAPSNSGYMLKISNIGTASPGLGGVKFGNVVNSNEVYIYTIVAKIPIGYTIEFATNSIGNDGTRYFLTSTAGTGKYEIYKYQVNVGTLSTASSTGYFFINGSQVGTVDAPINWYIAFANYSLISANNFSIAPLNSTHIGVYVDDLPSGSTDWKKYAWTLTKGQKGDQGLPGTPGADGKTPYWHTAWANSADGKTDFSLTDSTGRKYRGEYADYTQTDSTDPTKYKWVNMVGTVTTGNRNFLAQNLTVSKFSSKDFTTKAWSADYINETNTALILKSGETYTVSFDAEIVGKSTVATVNQLSVGFLLYSASTGRNVDLRLVASKNNAIQNLNQKGRFEATFVCPELASDHRITVYTNRYYNGTTTDNDTVKFTNVNWTLGNVVSKSWIRPLEDVDDALNSKADQALTQAQMLALEERSALARDNAIAEAMKNTISEVEAKWQTWYNLNTADEKQKVANDIASLFERVAEFKEDLGEASAKFSFINNETLIGEEGVAIGDKEGKAKLFLSNDSISFVTNGVAQMTLTGDTLTIKNGLFTERIQIGNYVEEVYDRNPLYNIIRPIKYS